MFVELSSALHVRIPSAAKSSDPKSWPVTFSEKALAYSLIKEIRKLFAESREMASPAHKLSPAQSLRQAGWLDAE